MRPDMRTIGSLATLLSAVSIALSCRDAEPRPHLYQDLGTESRPLLPTGSVWVDPDIRAGRAEWHPFREPGDLAAATSAPASPGQAAPTARQSQAETAIRSMIAEHNRIVADGRFEELPDFYVASQAETVGSLTKALPGLIGKLKELSDALPEKNARFEEVLEGDPVRAGLQLEVEAIEVVSAEEAKGRIVPRPGPLATAGAAAPEVRFVLAEDGYWYIDLPALSEIASALPMLEQSTSMIDQVIAGIKSGEIPANALSQQLEGAFQMLDAFEPPTGETDTEEQPAEEPARPAPPPSPGG